MPGYKPESKVGMTITKKYWAYDKDGNFKGEVKLTSQARERYERQFGMTFKTPSGSIY